MIQERGGGGGAGAGVAPPFPPGELVTEGRGGSIPKGDVPPKGAV